MTTDVVVPDPPASEEAPHGWMTDPKTGERRPRKRPGRRPKAVEPPAGKSPALEELQALGSVPEAAEDSAPAGAPKKGRGRPPAMKAESPLPPFRAGVIAKGVNKLYRKAGRILRIWDRQIGDAVIMSTRPDPDAEDDDEDTTIGGAWENLAKANPRVRRMLLRFIQGGAWSAVATAHLPILMAIMMKDGIRRRLPLPHLMDALLVDEDESGGQGPSDLSQMMGGVTPQDMAQMMQMAQGLMGGMAADVSRGMGVPREPTMGQE